MINKKFFVLKILILFLGITLFLVHSLYYIFGTKKLVIFYTNDLHGSLNLPVLSSYLNQQRKKIKNCSLLLDSGDFFQGTPEGDLSRGMYVLEVFNYLRYDAVTVGNHEFDQGEEVLLNLVKNANFPFLGSNVWYKNGVKVKYLHPFIIKKVCGVKVGIFGITSERTSDIVFKKAVEKFSFGNEIFSAKACVDELKKLAVDIIVGLTHIGFENDKILAEKVPEIDVIIGGHSHTAVKKPFVSRKYKTIICQTNGKGRTVGYLKLWIKNNKVVRYKNKLIPLDDKIWGVDEVVQKILKRYTEIVAKELDKPVGVTEVDLKIKKDEESNLGNLITDIMRKLTNCEIAFQNSGGIRAEISKGKITRRDIYNVLPFDNTIVTMKLSGKKIKEILEFSVCGKTTLMQVSGIKVKYDMTKPYGEKIVYILVNGQQLKEEKFYTVATNNFVAVGGDGYVMFKEGKDIKDTNKLLRAAVEEYIKTNSPIKIFIEGRILK